MKTRKVLVIAAHPDDEILGCGGTMAKHALAGDTVHVLILSRGVTSRFCAGEGLAPKINKLRDCAMSANSIIGVKSVEFGEFPDNEMDGVSLLEITKFIERKMESFAPDTVYTHHSGDLNIDHMITHRAVVTAVRPLPGGGVERLLFFEVLSSTEWQVNASQGFVPNWYVDISRQVDLKRRAIAEYADEMRQFPHPRSIGGVEALARFRGVASGLIAAEAFSCGRIVEL